MYHVAIMKKSWGFTDKIVSGEKNIESRWYGTRRGSWDRVSPGDTIYFKNSGEKIKTKAEVDRVMQFGPLGGEDSKKILKKYGEGIGIGEGDMPTFAAMFKNKKYCILMFLKTPKHVKPFDINKAGFGAMASWISVNSISKIKVS